MLRGDQTADRRPYPLINRRRVTTTVDVKDGQTIVIGGLTQTQIVDGKLVRVLSWYDNEYGYTCNMLRFVQHVAAN